MRVSVTQAKRQLTELVRCAEAGTRSLVKAAPDRKSQRALLETVRATAAPKAAGLNAARSRDFLYGDGLP
jgi:hypothetical protein